MAPLLARWQPASWRRHPALGQRAISPVQSRAQGFTFHGWCWCCLFATILLSGSTAAHLPSIVQEAMLMDADNDMGGGEFGVCNRTSSPWGSRRQLVEEEPELLAADRAQRPGRLWSELLQSETDIVYKNLNRVDLRYFQGISCKGLECPNFGTCVVDLPNQGPRPTAHPVKACWNPGLVDVHPITTTPPVNKDGYEDFWRGEPYAGQVFELHNVYINDIGDAMDAQHHYFHVLYCPSIGVDFGNYTRNVTRVHVFDEVTSVAYLYANYWHFVVEVLPAYVALVPVLKLKPDIPVLYRPEQEPLLHVFELLDVPSHSINMHRIPYGELVFAKTLYLPVQTTCGHPSQAALMQMRRDYFSYVWEGSENSADPPASTPAGAPAAARRRLASAAAEATVPRTAKGRRRRADNGAGIAAAEGGVWPARGPGGGSGGRAASAGVRTLGERSGLRQGPAAAAGGRAPYLGGGDCSGCSRWGGAGTGTGRRRRLHGAAGVVPPTYNWLVVVGRRRGSRQLVNDEELLRQLSELLPPRRLVEFDGTLRPQAAKKLFGRARLFISPHGAAQANEVMMPPDSAVLEVRPAGYNNACHHYLAELVGIDYYLLYGNGTKDTPLEADIGEVFSLARDIILGFCPECH